jgi:hypothetical protein
MILEEIEGNVNITYAGKTMSLGDSAEDYSKGVFVVGSGKAIFRVDPSSTFEIKGVEAAAYEADQGALTKAQVPQVVASAPAPKEIQITAESTVNAVETAVKVDSKESAAK